MMSMSRCSWAVAALSVGSVAVALLSSCAEGSAIDDPGDGSGGAGPSTSADGPDTSSKATGSTSSTASPTTTTGGTGTATGTGTTTSGTTATGTTATTGVTTAASTVAATTAVTTVATTVASTSTGTGGCHDGCEVGGPLDPFTCISMPSTLACATAVCGTAGLEYCCTAVWDDACVAQAGSEFACLFCL